MSLIGVVRRGALTGLVSATTCGGSLDVRRQLTLSPSPECLQAALTNSPQVSELEALLAQGAGTSFRLQIRDPEARDSMWKTGLRLEPAPDSSALVRVGIHFSPSHGPRNRAEAQRVQRLAAALISEVTEVCAPGTTAPIMCTVESDHPLVTRRSGKCPA